MSDLGFEVRVGIVLGALSRGFGAWGLRAGFRFGGLVWGFGVVVGVFRVLGFEFWGLGM